MKKHLIASILFPVCALAHHLLFWKEQLGLNTLLFALLMSGALFYLHPESLRSRLAWLAAGSVLLTAGMVVWYGSAMAKVAHVLAFIVLIGFVQGRELRFVFYAFCLGIASMLEMRWSVLRNSLWFGGQRQKRWRLASQAGTMAVVVPVFSLFFLLYLSANDKFAELVSRFSAEVWRILAENFSLSLMLSLLLSVMIAGGMLWKTSGGFFQKMQDRQTFKLARRLPGKRKTHVWWNAVSLKKEHRTAVLLVALLNLLLLIVNAVDVRYVWFGDLPDNPATFKQYVHEGTYLLIVAILLAMAVVLVFFRKNLNFLNGNEALKMLAYAWIAQNALLALSVGVRNWRYVEACGLAYKRIGVFVFLLLTLFGLGTLCLKIRDKRSAYFLLFQNGWAVYFVLVGLSLVNWDVAITRYNLTAETKNPVDVDFLINDVSDKNLFLLTKHTHLLKPHVASVSMFDQKLKAKWEQFEQKIAGRSWLSWNGSDWRNRQYLVKNQ